MKKILCILVVCIFLASTVSALTANKSIVKENDCGCNTPLHAEEQSTCDNVILYDD